MKNLITMIGCTMVLLMLLAQFVQWEKILLQHMVAERIASIHCEHDDVGGLRHALSRVMDCSQSDILVQVNEEEMEGGRMRRYRIEIPIEKILVSPEFWGISESQNRGVHFIEREVPHE